MSASDKFALKWNDFKDNISTSLRDLKDEQDFFDVTIASDDDHQIEAHKLVLSASSSFFKNILKNNKHQHPLIYLRGIKMTEIQAMVDFMYHGEVEVEQENLDAFLGVAKDLKVKGLTNIDEQKSLHKNGLNFDKIIKDKDFIPAVSELSQSIEIPGTNDIEDDIDMKEHDFDFEKEFKKEAVDLVSYQETTDSPSFINENIGMDEGLYKCNICGKKSSNRRSIRSHIETHSETPSYACPHCSKMCNTKNALNMHKKRNHSKKEYSENLRKFNTLVNDW